MAGLGCFDPFSLLRADEGPRLTPAGRSIVPGEFELHTRRRKESEPGSGQFEVVEETERWKAAETVIIVCDMWAEHTCRMAQHRVGEMAPRMNSVLTAARDLGAMIIHAPSSGMKHYEETPYRKRMQAAKLVKPPVPIKGWCYADSDHEAPYPIPYSTNVEDVCDDAEFVFDKNTSRRQHADIKIVGYDGVTDNGVEVYNFMEQEGLKNVVLMGVHTHFCVMGRSFGIRQMVYLGRNVVLARDMTDALYSPRTPPYVSHKRGTELAVEHIEKFWCPSILSQDLNRVV